MKRPYRDELAAILRLAGPLIAAQLAYVAMVFTDTVMMGKLGREALAGGGLGALDLRLRLDLLCRRGRGHRQPGGDPAWLQRRPRRSRSHPGRPVDRRRAGAAGGPAAVEPRADPARLRPGPANGRRRHAVPPQPVIRPARLHGLHGPARLHQRHRPARPGDGHQPARRAGQLRPQLRLHRRPVRPAAPGPGGDRPGHRPRHELRCR